MRFAEIVRSSPQVRESFSDLPLHSVWWRLILVLHGKPVELETDSEEAKAVLAKGFWFYGILYSCLAIAFACVIPIIVFSGIESSGYWVSLLLGSSCYLGLASKLAFSGSANYTRRPRSASARLVVFFVAIVAYLGWFSGFVLSIVHNAYPQYDFLVLMSVLAFTTIGIASYLIEILFLLCESGIRETK